MEKLAPSEDTLAGLLLTFTALSGELPTAQIDRLASAKAYQEKVLKALKSEKLLRTFYRNGLRALRLTSTGKKLLLNTWPDRFTAYLSGSTETNVLKSEVPRRLRLHRMAEVLVTMFNAGVTVYPWKKPALFTPSPPPSPLRVKRSSYYSSRELKELGSLAIKVHGSRATGILFSDGGIFIVYNAGSGQMKWELRVEMRLKALVQQELCMKRVPQFSEIEPNAIVFGAGMEQMPLLMGTHDGGQYNYFVLDGNFDHFYFLTSDHCGEVILRLLCDPGKRAVLDGILSQGLSAAHPGFVVENDAMDGDTPVLFTYTCDMPRIKRFDNALQIHDIRGTLYCFDFQEDAMRQICGQQVKIESLDLEKVKALLFDGDC